MAAKEAHNEVHITENWRQTVRQASGPSTKARPGAVFCHRRAQRNPRHLRCQIHLLRRCRREQTQAKHFKDVWGFLVSPEPPTSVSTLLEGLS